MGLKIAIWSANSSLHAVHSVQILPVLHSLQGCSIMSYATAPHVRKSDEIDYQIIGSEMQAVAVTLYSGEMVIAEAGSMMYMTSGIKMETVFGDPSAQSQGF